MDTDLVKTPPDTDSLLDLTSSGKSVKSRVADAEQAQEICNRLIRDDMIRADRRVKVQGLIDGNAPVAQKRLDKAGRGDDSNLNWREAKGQILNAWTPYFDLVIEVPCCIEGDLEYADSDQDQELMRGFAEYFHEMVFGWAGFDRAVQLKDWEMLSHGIGTWAWANEWDWRPEPVLCSNQYVDDVTYSDLSNAEMFMITKTMTVSELWRKISDPNKEDADAYKDAEAAGWKVESVKKCIMNASRSDSKMLSWKWDRWQQALKNGDIYVSQNQTKQIKVCILYVEEMDGSISQHIVQNYGTTSASPNDFLYSYVSRYKSWEECICPFPYDVGSDGTWHSVKGLGTEIFPYCVLSNKLKNSMCDLTLVGIKPMFQPNTGNDLQKWQLVRMGGFNLVPNGLTALQIDVSRGIQPAIELSREMRSTLNANTGTYQEELAAPTVEQTAKEATIRAMDRSKLNKGAHNRYYRSQDRAYRNMWRRAADPNLRAYHPGAKEALIFQDRCRKLCRKLGVSEDALFHVTNIRAMRSIGYGSAALRIDIANAVMQQYPLLDPVGQNNALRGYFSAIMSYANVNSLVPSITTGQIPTEDDSISVLENNALATGGQVQITPRQNHVIHLNHHIQSMEQDIQGLQSGGNPAQVFQSLEAKGVHAHEHLSILANNPTRKREVQMYNQRLMAISGVQDKIQQMLEEQAQNQPPAQGQPDPDMVKVQGNLALKAKKQEGDMALKQQKQQGDFALKTRQLGADIQLKDASTSADIAIKSKKSKATV